MDQQSGNRRPDGSSPAAKRRNPTGSGYQARVDFGGPGGYRSGRDSNHGAGRIQTPDPRSGNFRPQSSGYTDRESTAAIIERTTAAAVSRGEDSPGTDPAVPPEGGPILPLKKRPFQFYQDCVSISSSFFL